MREGTKKARIIALYDRGLRDRAEIARQVGTTRQVVYTVLSAHKRQDRANRIANAGPGDLGASTYHLRLPVGLEDRAVACGETPTALATRLLRVIARDDMYRAVLDEDGP